MVGGRAASPDVDVQGAQLPRNTLLYTASNWTTLTTTDKSQMVQSRDGL